MIVFLVIIYRPIFYLRQRFLERTLPPSSGKKPTFGPGMWTSSIDWTKQQMDPIISEEGVT
jgi:hypothetical protein